MKIAEALTTGLQIDFKCVNLNEPSGTITLSTIVESLLDEHRLVILAPMHQGHAYPLHKGETATIIFTHIEPLDHGKEHYSVNCVIEDHMVQGIQNYLIIRISGEPIKTLRRNAFRVNLMKAAQFIQTKDEQKLMHEIMILNMSTTGLKALCNVHFKNDDVLTLKIDLNEHPGDTHHVIHHDHHLEHTGGIHEIECTVRGSEVHSQVKGEYKVRVEFTKIPHAADQALSYYLLRMQSKEHALVHSKEDDAALQSLHIPDSLSGISKTMMQTKTILNFSMFVSTLVTAIVLTTAMPTYTTNIFKVLLKLESVQGVWNFDNLAIAIQVGAISIFWSIFVITIKRFAIIIKEPLFDSVVIILNLIMMAYMTYIYYL